MQFKRNLLSAALASATLMLAATAQAQTDTARDTSSQDASAATKKKADTQPTQLDTVQVTGIRRGIEDAIDTKQTASTIVEAVSAEDIGKLPDASIADSIARLPGLTAQRFGGRPQEINIRGFAGDFSTALLNGTEQVSLGNNRGVEFDQYPSEFTSQVVVHKTTEADLVGQGLSGTVDIQTVRPLSFDKRVMSVNVRGEMNKEAGSKAYGNRESFTYIDQFADHTVGLALGFARMNSPGQGRQAHSWGYDGNGAPSGMELWKQEDDNTRTGFVGTLEWKPTDDFHSVLDVFDSRFNKDTQRTGLQMGFANSTVGSSSSDGTAMTGTVDVSQAVGRNDYNSQHDKLFALNWANELRINDNWSVKAGVSTSSAKRKEYILETYAVPTIGLSSSVPFDYDSDGFYDFGFPDVAGDPDNYELRDPGGWGNVPAPLISRAQAGYLKNFTIKDTLSSFRLDFDRSFDSGFISSIDFGGNITERHKSRASTEGTLCITAACDPAANVASPIPDGYGAHATDFGSFGLPSLMQLDPRALVDGFYYFIPKDNPDISNKRWQVNERVGTLYAQANIDTNLGPVSLKGNVGVQWSSTSQDSSGYRTAYGNPVGDEISDGASYSYFLPSMNLAFGFAGDQFVRFGAGRQMARPRMDDMRANESIGTARLDDGSYIYTRDGGNPRLKPWLANAYDLSYEKYFGGNKGYVSAAYFFKDLKTYIYHRVDNDFDFSGYVIPPSDPAQGVPTTLVGQYAEPINGQGGQIKGYELTVSVPFELLWAPLEGFGFQGSYSNTQSSIQPNGPGTTEPLPGLSKYVSNATVYYERAGFSARVSRRTRSKFVGEFEGFGGDREKHELGGEKVIDAQVGYTFQSGPLENLSILLQANNLTNEPSRQTVLGYDDRFNDYFEYGRTFLLGVSYKF